MVVEKRQERGSQKGEEMKSANLELTRAEPRTKPLASFLVFVARNFLAGKGKAPSPFVYFLVSL